MQVTDLFVWGVFLGGALVYFVERLWRNNRLRRRMAKARAGEKKAVKFLEQRGYHILDVQLSTAVTIYLNDKPHTSQVRADLLVRKGRKKYIVEVKTGKQGSGTLPHVRRQLLEYYLVYQPDGVLLLDMEKEKLREVKFTYDGMRGKVSGFRDMVLGMALVAFVVLLLRLLG